MKSYKYKHGLTLVEILAVVAIIALLASIVIGVAALIDNQSKERCLESTFALLECALQEYCEYTGKFPEQPEKNFSNALVHSEYLYNELTLIPESRKILEKIADSLLKNKYGTADTPAEIYDPWGMALDYRYVPGDNFPELVSAGPDKIFGTADDINNR
ncbi:MAG: type II secretion system protein [Sedimentisphaerales bacterium]|jgi:prepilin-type N-terminal cleavage/methylation domain-containing protein